MNFLLRSSHSFKREGNDSESKFYWKEILNKNFPNNENNFQEDINIRQLQQNLIMMGFDITMINKIILYFKIRTEYESIDYLIKNEEGMWNHPFIPKEVINEPNNNNILE